MFKKRLQVPLAEGTTSRRTFVKGVALAPVAGGLLAQMLLIRPVIAHAQAQRNGARRIDTFAIGSDSAIWHKWFDNGVWSDWESLGGLFLNPPAVTSWDTGRLDIFVRGTDKALWHKWFDNGVWSNWESLGGVLYSDPAVCSWGTG